MKYICRVAIVCMNSKYVANCDSIEERNAIKNETTLASGDKWQKGRYVFSFDLIYSKQIVKLSQNSY